MSTQRVVTGVDDRGRPVSEWRQVTDDPGPAYGFMEPAHSAPIERRKATPEELAAARAREDEPDHLVAMSAAKPPTIAPFDPARDRASVLRGGAATAELNRRKPQPSPEEYVVPTDIPQIATAAPDANGEYMALADAAREVAYADAAAQAAQEALQMARQRLASALAGVGLAQPASTAPSPRVVAADSARVPRVAVPKSARVVPRVVTSSEPRRRETVRSSSSRH